MKQEEPLKSSATKNMKRSGTKQRKIGLFKNPAFLGFDINKTIDDGGMDIEPRSFSNKQQMRLDQKFNGFD